MILQSVFFFIEKKPALSYSINTAGIFRITETGSGCNVVFCSLAIRRWVLKKKGSFWARGHVYAGTPLKTGEVRYVASQYNYPLQVDAVDGIYLFNSLTTSLIRVPEPLLCFVEELAMNEPVGMESLPSGVMDFFHQLEGGGFYIPWNVDERELLRERFDNDYEPGVFSVSISPTFACNLSCNGCQRRLRETRMSRETSDDIIREVRRVISGGDISILKVWWIGGEPLLNLPGLEYLSLELLKLTQHAQIGYKALLVTNGVLLDIPIVERLSSLHIESIVVTLNGVEALRDLNCFAGGPSSFFSGVLAGIRVAASRFRVYLRIQVDGCGLGDARELVNQMDARGCLTGNPYPVIPFPALDGPWGETCNSKLFSLLPFPARYDDIFQFQLQTLKRAPGLKPSYFLELPRSLNRACIAQGNNVLQVSPEGQVFRCGQEYHHAPSAAPHIRENFRDQRDFSRWTAMNPLDIPICRDCSFLPLCMGGCAHRQFRKNDREKGELCRNWHQYIDAVLRQVISYIGAW